MPLQTAQPFTASYTQADIPATASAVRSAAWDQALNDLPGASIVRATDLSFVRSITAAQKFSPTEASDFMEQHGLKAQFTFDRDYNELELNILASRKRRENARADVLARAEGSGSSAVGRMGIALASNLLDPLAIGSAFVPVIGEARYASLVARAGSAVGRAGVRAGVGALEGVAGAALVEPIIAGAKIQEQADYRFADSFLNVTIGGVFGGGLHVAGGLLRDVLRPAREPSSLDLINRVAASEPAHSAIPVMSEAEQALAARVIAAREELQGVHGDILRQANEMLDREVSTLKAVPTPAEGPGWGRLETAATEQRAVVDSMASRVAADYEPAAVRAEIDRLTNDAEFVSALRSKYRQRTVTDRIARQAKENVATRRTVIETKLAEQRFALEQTQAQVDAHRNKNAAEQRLEFIRTFRKTDDARKLLETIPPEAQERMRSRLDAATKEAATLLESPEAKALIDKHPPARWTVANSSLPTREVAMRSAVAQAVSGESIEVRPVFERSTFSEAGRRIANPDELPLSDPQAVVRADQSIAAGERTDLAAVQANVAELEAHVKALQGEQAIDDEAAGELLAVVRGDIDDAHESRRNAVEFAKAAALIVACALKHSL